MSGLGKSTWGPGCWSPDLETLRRPAHPRPSGRPSPAGQPLIIPTRRSGPNTTRPIFGEARKSTILLIVHPAERVPEKQSSSARRAGAKRRQVNYTAGDGTAKGPYRLTIAFSYLDTPRTVATAFAPGCCGVSRGRLGIGVPCSRLREHASAPVRHGTRNLEDIAYPRVQFPNTPSDVA